MRAIILYVDNLPVSYWICFRYLRSLYLYYTGYVASFRRFEPGTLALFQVIDDACREGLDYIYMGSGPYGYQKKYSNAHYPDCNVVAFSGTPRGVMVNLARLAIQGPIELIRQGAELVGLETRLKGLLTRTPERRD